MISCNTMKLSNLLRSECCFKGISKWYSSQATATAAINIQYEEALRRAKPLSEMPAPPMLPYIGSAWLYFPIIGRYDRKKLHMAFRQNRQRYGNVYRDKIGPLNLVVSFEAEDMETVFRNEGPYPFRSVMSTIKTYRESRKHWYKAKAVAYVGLDARLGCFENSESDGIKMINAVQTQFELLNKLESVRGNIQLWKWFPSPKWRKFVKASDVFSEIAFRYIIQACDKLNKMDKKDKELTLLQAMLATEGLALDGAMVMVADMLFAGIDTTSHTSGFLLYELAKNPDKQELLYQEINKILSSTGGKLTQAVFSDLKYLKSCLKESLRLHPIASVGARVLDHDVVISGYRVPAKTTIAVGLQELSMDERYFKNPTQFLPERWQNKEEKPHPFAYLPFGFGPRSCIGRRLAELEIMCLMIEIIRKYKVEYHYEDIDIVTRFIAAPDKPLKFSFIERTRT